MIVKDVRGSSFVDDSSRIETIRDGPKHGIVRTTTPKPASQRGRGGGGGGGRGSVDDFSRVLLFGAFREAFAIADEASQDDFSVFVFE